MESQTLQSSIQAGNPDGLKWCRYCERDLPLTEFGVRKASRDGLGYKCKECQKKYNHTRYRDNATSRQAAKDRASKWRLENPDRRRQIVNKSAKKHRLKKAQWSREYNKRQRQLFPEKMRLLNIIGAAKRRTRFHNAGIMPPVEAISLMIKMARGRCVYCGRTDRPLTLDHIDPVARKGANVWDNFIPCCKPCNCSKQTKEMSDWLFECRGIEGLVDAYVFLLSVKKAIKRLYPSLYQEYADRVTEALNVDD